MYYIVSIEVLIFDSSSFTLYPKNSHENINGELIMNNLYEIDALNITSINDENAICMDYPDPDVIRVGNNYYMVSTTMHFFPGCEILSSTDLVNWKHACYVYEKLDSTEGQTLRDGKGIYGKGMWAATIRYHKDTFYIMFVCNDTQKTYLYTLKSIDGILDESCSFKWAKQYVEGFYHDCSLLFDTDDEGNSHIYVAYGNTDIYLTELSPDLHGPLEGGLHRLIISDQGNPMLGYEGSHLYKINGKYYIFLIHLTRDAGKRTEACFMTDSITGDFVGGDILNDDWGYCNSGIAQGGIVDTPDGKWYALLFQDRGAVGRIPILTKMHFEGDKPIIDKEYSYLNTPNRWQFNHEPDLSLVNFSIKNNADWKYSISTNKICHSIQEANNTLTNRLYYPISESEIDIDVSHLNNGDIAGLAILQGCHGFIGIKKENDAYYLFTESKCTSDASPFVYTYNINRSQEIPIESMQIRLGFTADFNIGKDTAQFYYYDNDLKKLVQPGVHNMLFKLDHFTGNRVALFMYSEETTGGSVTFSNYKCSII